MTTTIPLPEGHYLETVRPGSQFLGQLDGTTRKPIRVGDVIMVCGRVPNPLLVFQQSWIESVPECPSCHASNPLFDQLRPSTEPGKKIPVGGKPGPTTTVVVDPDQLPDYTRRRQGSLVPFLLALLAIAIVLLALAVLVRGNGNGSNTGGQQPTSRPPTSVSVVIAPTQPPTPRPTSTPRPASPPSTVAPTPRPLPSKRALPPSPAPVNTPAPKSPIRALVLVNAANDRDLFSLADGMTISLSQNNVRYLTIVANTATSVGSIRFQLDGQDLCLNGPCYENSAPYSMAGDVNGDHYANWDWRNLIGSHTIKAIPYTGRDGTGDKLPAVSMQLKITN